MNKFSKKSPYSVPRGGGKYCSDTYWYIAWISEERTWKIFASIRDAAYFWVCIVPGTLSKCKNCNTPDVVFHFKGNFHHEFDGADLSFRNFVALVTRGQRTTCSWTQCDGTMPSSSCLPSRHQFVMQHARIKLLNITTMLFSLVVGNPKRCSGTVVWVL